MEPQWMIIGHPAGFAASLAPKANKPPHEIETKQLQEILMEQGAVFNYVQGPHEKAHAIIRERLKPKGISRFNWE